MVKKIVMFLLASFLFVSFMFASNEKFEVKEKKLDSFKMVYYEFNGPYAKSFEQFGELVNFLKKKGVKIGTKSVGIYFDDPKTTAPEKLRSEIGIIVDEEVKTSGKFKFKKVESCHAISTFYNSMDEVEGAWSTLGKYLMEKKLMPSGPGFEFYTSEKPNSGECFMPIQKVKK